ncbi:MAG: DUF3253 domain-containing protein [Alphaproteobacteria bacterium]|nr:DUF3253 domain-containing protein [Alphaproteobacteria bacterium]
MNIDRETREALATAVRELTTARGSGKSICPSEAARKVAEDKGTPENWRWMLKPLRKISQDLARDGEIVILRKGKPIAPEDMRGVVRLALPGAQGGTDVKPDWRGSISLGGARRGGK